MNRLKPLKAAGTYAELLRRVKETLIHGFKAGHAVRVEYWPGL